MEKDARKLIKKDNTIFVFGANKQGRHGKGSALEAKLNWGAIYGQGEGRQGQSYGIPTKETPYKSLSLDEVRNHVNIFIEYANNHPELEFYVVKIGCNLAGFREEQIKPLFSNAPKNCILPVGWENG